MQTPADCAAHVVGTPTVLSAISTGTQAQKSDQKPDRALETDDPALGDAVSLLLSTISILPNTDLANITVGPFGGLADALINYLPQQILTTDPGGTSILSGLDPSTLLSGLDLGNLGGLLDPTTLVGDLTSLLPGLASDLPAGLADLATLIPF